MASTCPVCKTAFANDNCLAQHTGTNTHADRMAYICDECNAKFCSYSAMESHRDTVHTTCPICSKKFPDNISLVNHTGATRSSDRQERNCRKCNIKFCNKKTWYNHETTKHCSTWCERCACKFKDRQERLKHARDVHGVFPCSYAGCTKPPFPSELALKQHQKAVSHLEEQAVDTENETCTVEVESEKNNNGEDSEDVNKTDPSILTCRRCKQVFATWDAFHKHYLESGHRTMSLLKLNDTRDENSKDGFTDDEGDNDDASDEEDWVTVH